MSEVLLIIHLFLALAIIGLVLLQRSEGGGLGIGGGSGGMGGLASAESTANLLTRATAICAGLFFCTSLILGILAGRSSQPTGLIDALDADAPAAIEAPAEVEIETPVDESQIPDEPPTVPVAE